MKWKCFQENWSCLWWALPVRHFSPFPRADLGQQFGVWFLNIHVSCMCVHTCVELSVTNSLGWTWTHFVAQAGFQLVVFVPPCFLFVFKETCSLSMSLVLLKNILELSCYQIPRFLLTSPWYSYQMWHCLVVGISLWNFWKLSNKVIFLRIKIFLLK